MRCGGAVFVRGPELEAAAAAAEPGKEAMATPKRTATMATKISMRNSDAIYLIKPVDFLESQSIYHVSQKKKEAHE